MKQKPVNPAVANALTRAASLGVDVLSLKGKSLTALTQFFRGVDALTEERHRREREAKEFDLTADNPKPKALHHYRCC